MEVLRYKNSILFVKFVIDIIVRRRDYLNESKKDPISGKQI